MPPRPIGIVLEWLVVNVSDHKHDEKSFEKLKGETFQKLKPNIRTKHVAVIDDVKGQNVKSLYTAI